MNMESRGLSEKRLNYIGGSMPINEENKSCPSGIKSRKILKALNITTNIKQISSVFSFVNDLP